MGKVSGYKHDPKTFRSTALMTTGGDASAGTASGGYAEDGSFVDSTGQASAMGTRASFLALSEPQQRAVVAARAKGRHPIHPNIIALSKLGSKKSTKTVEVEDATSPAKSGEVMTAQEAATEYGGGMDVAPEGIGEAAKAYGGGMDVAPTVTASETGEHGGIFKKGGLATKSKPKQKKSRRSKGLASL